MLPGILDISKLPHGTTVTISTCDGIRKILRNIAVEFIVGIRWVLKKEHSAQIQYCTWVEMLSGSNHTSQNNLLAQLATPL